jgi:ubiquinone/menaquinone biosynthesis C-methylase UbiE
MEQALSVSSQFIKEITSTSLYGSKSVILIMALIIIAIILVMFSFANRMRGNVEGFAQMERMVVKEGVDVYDAFYAPIYGQIMDDPRRCGFEIKEIMRTTGIVNKGNTPVILDVGCGDGDHLEAMMGQMEKTKTPMLYTALDLSPHMLRLCKKRTEKKAKEGQHMIEYIEGDATDGSLFEYARFTHIFALYFSLYCVEDKPRFFDNAYQWLQSGGHLVIHLVNKDKFDPIVNPANPFYIVSPQKYAKERIMESSVKFDDFDYKAKFEVSQNMIGEDGKGRIAYFNETMKDHAGHIRKNKHILYMESQSEILAMAKTAGFIMKGKIDMAGCGYDYQYLYVLYKGNEYETD